jgi:phage regulator Rha-like protein
MKTLVQVVSDELKVSHRDIADGTNNQAKNIAELINKYKDRFDRFGNIEKDVEIINAGNGSTQKITFWLNEDQTTFLITLLRNNEIVLDFKFRLVQEFRKMKNILLNPNIHELSGRVGGLTRSNNELRKELDKWKKKSKRRFENLEDDVDELKKRPIMITHKNLDEKLEILFRKSDILANEKTECFWQEALQNHNRFYKEYVQILKSDGNDIQKWAINQVENEKKKRVDVEKELCTLKWRFEIMLEKMTNLQNLAKNIVNFDIENERNYIKND